MNQILEIRHLKIRYANQKQHVVNDLSFSIGRGEIVGVMGPSGCGKTTVTKAILGLLEAGSSLSGEIYFKNQLLANQEVSNASKFWWKEISIVSQSSMSSFNPSYTLLQSIDETLKYNGYEEDKVTRAQELMTLVHLSTLCLDMYPHQLSGGMKQRAAIAMAIAMNPDLVILDESTTGLDVLVEAKILKMILELKENLGMSFLMISHDKRIIEAVSNQIIQMEVNHETCD